MRTGIELSATAGSARVRGRPVGSVKLTLEIERTILAYIESGSFDYIAAEAAGVDQRTFRDWIARGEGRHPTRRKTRQLSTFAAAVRAARARARVSREIVVADRDPKFWLQHAARSKPGREGWSEPVEELAEDGAGVPAFEPDPTELAAMVAVLVEAGVLELSPCGDPGCRCSRHGGTDVED